MAFSLTNHLLKEYTALCQAKSLAKERIPSKNAVMAVAAAILATTSVTEQCGHEDPSNPNASRDGTHANVNGVSIDVTLPLVNPVGTASCSLSHSQLFQLSDQSGLMFADGQLSICCACQRTA
jgi:hypothetical protein